MSQELVKCPCCDKMVSANSIELIFRKPDFIASLSESEIKNNCRYSDDVFTYKTDKFYIRCILPIPVHEKDDDYCLGVWVKVTQEDFEHIYNIWEIKDQTNELPIVGLLANDVPLTKNTLNAEIKIQLIGDKSRPIVTITDQSCSLKKEQMCGISIHRANEFSDLCR